MAVSISAQATLWGISYYPISNMDVLAWRASSIHIKPMVISLHSTVRCVTCANAGDTDDDFRSGLIVASVNSAK